MNRAEQIKQKVKDRGIRWLVHFTHIQNVDSILEHGIMPPNETRQLEATLEDEETFIFPDKYRADGKNASCLSIMFPNNEMLWHKRQEYGDEAWVFLLLKPDILWECDCAFYPTNAASAGLRHEPVEKFKTAEAFEAMFAREVQKQTNDETKTIPRSSELKPYLPTDVQAEVLVFNIISPDYIGKCCFHWNLGDVASILTPEYPHITFFPNNEWVKNKTEHVFYCFRNQVNWKWK